MRGGRGVEGTGELCVKGQEENKHGGIKVNSHTLMTAGLTLIALSILALN